MLGTHDKHQFFMTDDGVGESGIGLYKIEKSQVNVPFNNHLDEGFGICFVKVNPYIGILIMKIGSVQGSIYVPRIAGKPIFK